MEDITKDWRWPLKPHVLQIKSSSPYVLMVFREKPLGTNWLRSRRWECPAIMSGVRRETET